MVISKRHSVDDLTSPYSSRSQQQRSLRAAGGAVSLSKTNRRSPRCGLLQEIEAGTYDKSNNASKLAAFTQIDPLVRTRCPCQHTHFPDWPECSERSEPSPPPRTLTPSLRRSVPPSR